MKKLLFICLFAISTVSFADCQSDLNDMDDWVSGGNTITMLNGDDIVTLGNDLSVDNQCHVSCADQDAEGDYDWFHCYWTPGDWQDTINYTY